MTLTVQPSALASAGASFGPWGAAAGAALGALSNMAGSGPAGPSSANGNRYDARFDSSGWLVNFGKGGISATQSKNETSSEAAGLSATPLQGAGMIAAGLIGVALLWRMLKKS